MSKKKSGRPRLARRDHGHGVAAGAQCLRLNRRGRIPH